jgi:hypothetical protein
MPHPAVFYPSDPRTIPGQSRDSQGIIPGLSQMFISFVPGSSWDRPGLGLSRDLKCLSECGLEWGGVRRRVVVQTDRQTDRQADRQTDRQTDRQKDGQTDRQTDRQTERQTADG